VLNLVMFETLFTGMNFLEMLVVMSGEARILSMI